MTGYTQKEWLADHLFWRQTVHPDDLPGVLARDVETNLTGAPYRVEYRLITRDGRTLWINEEARAELDEHGQIARWQGVMLDVTEQRLAEECARERASQFQFVYARSPLPMWIYDIETLAFLDVNDAAITHYGYSRETFLGMRITDIRPEEEVPRFLDYLNRTSSWNGPSSAWTHRTNDGRLIEVEIAAHSLTFAGRSANLAVINDVTARHAREEDLANQAFHDALTGLPNRALFIDRLEHALARASRQNSATAVLFVDLDNFKAVNDTLGHTAGDQLLVAAGQRLAACARTGDTIARLGGDEFTVLLEDISSPEDAIAVAECVLASLDNAFVVGGQDIHVTPSIGIATTLPGHDAPEDLLCGADLAMYEAKRHGRSRFALLDTAMNARVRVRLELETDLRRAIDDSQFRTHYQPILDLNSGRVVEMESLLRWEHPVQGLILPADFILQAEETGLILPIGLWLLESAAAQAEAWRRAELSAVPLVITVNLSGRHLQQASFVREVAAILDRTGLAPHLLKLEITESVALDSAGPTVATLRALKELGVRLGVDDFGAGYSGLSALKCCPVDTLKIDRAFVRGLGRAADDTAIVRTIIGFAKALGLLVSAEGVENRDQLNALQALGCDLGQGDYFSPPLPAVEIETLLGGGGPTWPVFSPYCARLE